MGRISAHLQPRFPLYGFSRLAILCLCLQPLSLGAAGTLNLAADDWPPFTGPGGSAPIAQDIVAMALLEAGSNSRVSLVPWPDALAGARAGDFDGLVVAWESAERPPLPAVFRCHSAESHFRRESGGAELRVNDIADLDGVSVAKVRGYTYGAALDAAPIRRVAAAADDQQALDLLLERKVDVALIDDLALRYLLGELSPEQRVRVRVHGQLATLDLHFALASALPRAGSIMAAFNRAIAGMMADGRYNELLGLPWLLVDTDADGTAELVPGRGALDLSAPPADDSYPVIEPKPGLQSSGQRVYTVGGRHYQDWEDAKRAIIDEGQRGGGKRMIQENRYEIGVPL